jgi:agmatine/peptidylarginine deiminase
LNQLLGVRDWILAGGFEQEITGHADVHMRFLGPKLAAVAWNEDNPDDQQCCIALEHALLASLPNLDIIRLPLRSEDGHYASPLNWLQFGKQLLVPRYPLTPAADIRTIEQRLQQAGFKSRFIYSPTLEYAGSLHCLTASLYV